MRNLVLALRGLSRTPIVTIVAALSLGLGIGSNAAIYSIYHKMLKEKLPVRDPGRLVNLSAPGPKPGSQSCGQSGPCEHVLSYPMFRDLQRARPAGFADIVGHRDFGANVSYERRSSAEMGWLVSGNYFQVLGLQPALGRLIAPTDDETAGAHPVVVLGYHYWDSKLGADSTVVGKTLVVNGQAQTIIGVAPKGFDGTSIGSRPSFYAPMVMSGTIGTGTVRRMDDRRTYWVYAFGRLAPGATMEQAKTAINAVYSPIIKEIELPLQVSMRDSVKPQFAAKQLLVLEGSHGQTDFDDAQTPLVLLFAITGLVLLIACANIANLLMTRATNREMEMAVRLSLGATRRQLLAQLLTESVALAAIGGAASVLFASWTLRGISALLPPDISEPMQFGINWAPVTFAAVLSLATGIAFGLFPAMHSTRPDLVTALRNNSGKLAGGRTARRFRSSLATAQVALAMALLMTAGLFLKSLWKVSRVDVGMNVERLVLFSLDPEQSGYDTTRMRALFTRVEEDLAGLPGATAVTATVVPMIAGSNWNNSVRVEGFKADESTNVSASYNAVSPRHFSTTGVPLLAGREFDGGDAGGRPRVAIVNEAFAKKFNLGANPVGKRMALGRSDTLPLDIEIVGLVRDAKYSRVKRDVPPVFFMPHKQRPASQMFFYVRTNGDPAAMMRIIPSVVQRYDPDLPIEELRTMDEEIRLNTFEDRMISTLSASFAVLATLLAAIGLYGVLAYSVAQRTREIGVRMALGAASAQVRGMVLLQVARMVAIGGTIGVAAALGLGKVAQSILFEMSGADPFVMVASVVLLAMVAMGAGYVPAVRASRVDPMQALRYE